MIQPASDSAGVRVPPPLVFIVALLLALVLEAVVATPDLPGPLAVVAGVLGVAVWVALDASAMRRFQRAGTSAPPWRPVHALVREGPYRLTRNPMYLGMLAALVGLGSAFGLLWVLALAPLVLLLIDRTVVRREEAYLERKFGDEYRRYRQEVRRWL